MFVVYGLFPKLCLRYGILINCYLTEILAVDRISGLCFPEVVPSSPLIGSRQDCRTLFSEIASVAPNTLSNTRCHQDFQTLVLRSSPKKPQGPCDYRDFRTLVVRSSPKHPRLAPSSGLPTFPLLTGSTK